MKVLTICLSYYNQSQDVVVRHLNYWNKYSKKIKDKITFFIVDDCSKISINELINLDDYLELDIKLYRVLDDLYCNIAGVRNLSAIECKTHWMLILDMDTYVSNIMAEQLLLLIKTSFNKTAYKFNRKVLNDIKHIKHHVIHPAICLIKKCDYWDIGGCEEDLVGSYGYTDPCFWHRAKKTGLIVKNCNDIKLHYFEDGESDINRDTTKNFKLYSEKLELGNWSTDFIRFKWTKLN